MQIVVPTHPFRSRFKLPDDWIVEEKPRSSINYSSTVDKYYYEPGTGRKFRSLLAVERYLTGAENDTYTPKMLTSGTENTKLEELHQEREMQIVVRNISSTSSIKLPDGWVMEEKPRRSVNSTGRVDKYYYEPGTGRQFRSLISVKRYLTEAKENTTAHKALKPGCQYTPSYDSGSQEENVYDENLPLKVIQKYLTEAKQNTNTPKVLKPGTHSPPSKSSGSRKKNVSGEKVTTSMFNSASLPAKINWVLTGPGGNIWSPFMGESMVPDSVKKKWSETFVLSVHD